MTLSKQEREELLRVYSDLRVTDVRDGMDTLMLHNVGSMHHSIRPVFRTKAFGIAKTVRYVPADEEVPRMSPSEYWEWVGLYYKDVCPYPFLGDAESGDFCVIDQSGVDCGLMGSNNSLAGIRSGVRGYVTNGGVRDTDELIIQKVPFWAPFMSQKMVQGRLKYDSKDIPVSVGGVLVYPGDVVVGDGDGVIVVPRKFALDVARFAQEEHQRDKVGRRRLYQDMGMKLDETV